MRTRRVIYANMGQDHRPLGFWTGTGSFSGNPAHGLHLPGGSEAERFKKQAMEHANDAAKKAAQIATGINLVGLYVVEITL